MNKKQPTIATLEARLIELVRQIDSYSVMSKDIKDLSLLKAGEYGL
jgi:hypothetical protein